MSQAEVIKYLKKKKGKWISTNELNEKLDISSASSNLNKLFKHGEVDKDLRLNPKRKGGFMAYWRLK